MWSSEYGPIINFPGLGWTAEQTLTYRDANIDNDEFTEQYLAMDRAQSFDEFVDAHASYQGIPLFNTIAVSRDGRAWYADTSATPELFAACRSAVPAGGWDDPITAIAADNGAVLLDGSDSVFEWEEVDGARDPVWCRSTRCRWSSAATTCSTPTTASGCPTRPRCWRATTASSTATAHRALAAHTRERHRAVRRAADAPAGETARSPPRSCVPPRSHNGASSARFLLVDVVARLRDLRAVRCPRTHR